MLEQKYFLTKITDVYGLMFLKKYGIYVSMRWYDEVSLFKEDGITHAGINEIPPDYARLIIQDAFSEGYINWNVYHKAMGRYRTVMNGSWMFKKKDGNPA